MSKKKPAWPEPLFEATDSNDQPFMLMPAPCIFTQPVYCRVVAVALFLKDGRLCLTQNFIHAPGKENPESWGLFSTLVRAGESRKDAALRTVHRYTGFIIPVLPLSYHLPLNRIPRAHTTLHKSKLPKGIAPKAEEALFLDKDELEGLMAVSPDAISSEVGEAHEQGILFI